VLAADDPYLQALQGPILVLGAGGFIGANLYHAIAAGRSDVVAVVRSEEGWRLAEVPDDKVMAADLTDPVAVKALVETTRPRTVFNCTSYGAYSFERGEAATYASNVMAVVHLVAALRDTGLAAFVHAGSSSEYGTNCSAPPEDAPCVPNSEYAASKLAATEFLRYEGKQRGFPCVTLRLYAIYGPLEDTSRLIPNLLRAALAGGYPPLVDPQTSRDFLHVEDTCRAFIQAAARMGPDLRGEVFNIGSGQCTTIADLAVLARDTFKLATEPTFGTMANRSWDLPRWFACVDRARQGLGWEPAISLVDGLRQTARWVETLTEETLVTATKQGRVRSMHSVSAIVACYKDAEAIPHMHRRLTEVLQALGVDYEIIFVNDCSPDASAAEILAISARDPHVVGISHSRNFGSQMAFRSGMELATMSGVVLLDGDLQDPPELIAEMHARWREGHDVVYGRRVRREMPWHQELWYKSFYRVFRAFSYVPVPEDAGDFSLMDRRVVAWLLACPERDLFIRGLRAYIGFKQTSVDYVRPERMFGRSTNNILRNIEWAKRGIYSFSNAPLTMLTTLGVVGLLVSALLVVASVVAKVAMPAIAPRGITTLQALVLLLGSLNLFAIGLVGEYVGKIMIEVKGRPRLIRAGLIRHGQVSEVLADGKRDGR
jgi:dolichol-phosphate mannosyltransferase